jgi:flagellar basal-body rod modification protein FlgD
MIDSISNPTLFSTTGTTTRTASKSLDADAFMTLLVTQLRNQDPLSPMDPEQMAAQLAQFTTVEQLSKLNDTVSSQESTLQLDALLSKTSFSAALIGRQIVAQGNQVTIPTSGAAKVRIEVGTGGGKATLRLLDSSGNLVTTRDLGTLPAGRQTLTLPSDLPAGDYHYEIKVTGANDTSVAVATFVTGTVDGVAFQDGGIILRVGSLEIPIEDLAEVAMASTAAASS